MLILVYSCTESRIFGVFFRTISYLQWLLLLLGDKQNILVQDKIGMGLASILPVYINEVLVRRGLHTEEQRKWLQSAIIFPSLSITGMLGKSFASPLLTFDFATCCISAPDLAAAAPSVGPFGVNLSSSFPKNVRRGPWTFPISPKKWVIYSTLQVDNIALDDEERKTWEASRQALSAFDFSAGEKDKILAKAFGHVHSPYWSEERKKEMPKFEIVSEILDYLRTLALSDDDLYKLLKKFPEVLGCSLEDEVRNNVQILEKDWAIKGKTLRNLLLRNPKVLGYNIDCKGDCMAKCTRCWVRF